MPTNIQLRHTTDWRNNTYRNIDWSPDGLTLASGSRSGTITLWHGQTGKLSQVLVGHTGLIHNVVWSPSGVLLASNGVDGTIRLWDTKTGTECAIINRPKNLISSIAWSPSSNSIATGATNGTIEIWKITASSQELSQFFEGHSAPVRSIAWSPDGLTLASSGDDGTVRLHFGDAKKPSIVFEGHNAPVRSIAWSPDGLTLASSGDDGTVRLWDIKTEMPRLTLEGHTDHVSQIAWTPNGQFIASGADDGGIRVWRCDTWETVKFLEKPSSKNFAFSISFHPVMEVLTTIEDGDITAHCWDLDTDALGNTVTETSIHYTSAKIVIVGESSVGKSCLAMRLVEDRYEEQGVTHGMRIWSMRPEQLSPDAIPPSGEERDILIWDLGGQDEYRLVHQLFLHDTTLALILLEPRRAPVAFEEVEGWNLRLEKQMHNRKTVKLLVGTKLDEESELTDRVGLENLIKDCGFDGYYETSAKSGRGFQELRHAISKVINWKMLTKTSRPSLFQKIRDEIDRRLKKGEVVLLYSELEGQIFAEDPVEFDLDSINAVVEQLALQGIIADARLSSGERVLVLQIGEVVRYAGSLIIAARNNTRGVPAIEEHVFTSVKMSFPGIKDKERLNRFQERIVLECVVQLLVEHGICLRHEGLLIFPSLFQSFSRGNSRNVHYTISLYYDFSGAIDNIYSSLVVRLAISERFGRVRLWEDQAEFEKPSQGVCGIRKVGRRSGFAHLDLFFSNETPNEQRNLFTIFIEEHLGREGVNITEVLEVRCPCGYSFEELLLRERLASAYTDVVCPRCETRNRINGEIKRTPIDNLDVEGSLLALKTNIDRKSKEAVVAVKQAFKKEEDRVQVTEPIRILHLSDLHLTSEEDPMERLHPLIKDLEDPKGGLGIDHLDYLVISGDLTNRASPQEFEAAYQFISELIARFRLTAQRCIIVPGNHDLSWEQEVYVWRQRRLVDSKYLKQGTFIEQGSGLLVREEAKYPTRFENFAKFYHSLIQQAYPLAAEDQCVPFLFEDSMIQFLAMNSAWEIDEFFPSRSSINSSALSRGLGKADQQIYRAKRDGRLPKDSILLRIAVWHHPVTGNEKIVSDAFLERLQQEDVQLCLHGHVHEDRADIVNYLHPARRIHIVGAGSFGASVYNRPESVPRLYNILEIPTDRNHIRVHTRCLRKEGGAWTGWAVWPGQSANERQTFYDIVTPGLALPDTAPAQAHERSERSTAVLSQVRTAEFDVFLCHNGIDKPAVKEIGKELKRFGILPWLDEWELRPGLPWQRLLEQQIEEIKSAAVFVGSSGIGPWQLQELDAFLREFVRRGCPVIPVLLPNAPQKPTLPIFLSGMTWVDFRHASPDPMDQLIWGITGNRSISRSE